MSVIVGRFCLELLTQRKSLPALNHPESARRQKLSEQRHPHHLSPKSEGLTNLLRRDSKYFG